MCDLKILRFMVNPLRHLSGTGEPYPFEFFSVSEVYTECISHKLIIMIELHGHYARF